VSREVILYTRKQCGLCDETASELHLLRDELRFTLRELDIDDDADLRERYNDVVPVVAVGEHVIAHAPVDPAALRKSLIERLQD
jgi:glutaredoxin